MKKNLRGFGTYAERDAWIVSEIKSGRTRADLARELGVSKWHISRIAIRGGIRPTRRRVTHNVLAGLIEDLLWDMEVNDHFRIAEAIAVLILENWQLVPLEHVDADPPPEGWGGREGSGLVE